MEVALGRGKADHRARGDTVDEVRRQEAVGIGLDGDGDGVAGVLPERRQRVRAPVPASVDLQTDADVLAGFVVRGESPARLDDDRRRDVGLLTDLDDASAQLARRPQRIDQVQVVVGQ